MALFQESVLKKYLNELQEAPINAAFNHFQTLFGSAGKELNRGVNMSSTLTSESFASYRECC
jgi:hypothetical protein